tara:strand:+ start:1659 stop:2315 length:657 start_codon:yes stop_codon:yes gene_type:complete
MIRIISSKNFLHSQNIDLSQKFECYVDGSRNVAENALLCKAKPRCGGLAPSLAYQFVIGLIRSINNVILKFERNYIMSMKKIFEIIESSSEFVQVQVLRNICYSSNSDMDYQRKQGAQYLAEARHIMTEEYNGSEIQGGKLDRLREFHERCMDQFAECEKIHNEARKQYKKATGNDWVLTPKKQPTSDKAKTASAGYWQKLIGKTEAEYEDSKKRKAS